MDKCRNQRRNACLHADGKTDLLSFENDCSPLQYNFVINLNIQTNNTQILFSTLTNA